MLGTTYLNSNLNNSLLTSARLYYGASATEATITLSDSLANYKMVSIRALWYTNYRAARVFDISTFRNLKSYLSKILFEDDPANTGHYIQYQYISDTQVKIKTSVANVNIEIAGIK